MEYPFLTEILDKMQQCKNDDVKTHIFVADLLEIVDRELEAKQYSCGIDLPGSEIFYNTAVELRYLAAKFQENKKS